MLQTGFSYKKFQEDNEIRLKTRLILYVVLTQSDIFGSLRID